MSPDRESPDRDPLDASEHQADQPGTSLFQVERQRQIYRLALRAGSVDVSELAQRFEVTTETIRRDLSELQERQLVRRVHGGAVPIERTAHEPMVDAREAQNADQKLAIAKLAAVETPLTGSILIDSGSTTHRLAEALPLSAGQQIFTNSLVSAVTLARRGAHQLAVLPGNVQTNTFAMVDASAVDAVKAMRFDVVFMSCDGLSFQRGLTTPYRPEYLLKRAMIERARKVVALVDQSKFGNDQTYCFASLDEIDVLFTDSRATHDEMEILLEAGIDVRRPI